MPPVVMVVPHFINRNAECECSEAFADFMADELLPWVRANYHVTSAREKTIVGGFSYGGLAAAFCAFRHPDVFGNVLTMSGSYWWFPGAGMTDGQFRREPGWLTRRTSPRRCPHTRRGSSSPRGNSRTITRGVCWRRIAGCAMC
jgi:enterochelin esterase family protein